WDRAVSSIREFRINVRTNQTLFEGKCEVSVILNDSKIQIWTDRSSFNNGTTRAQAGHKGNYSNEQADKLSKIDWDRVVLSIHNTEYESSIRVREST
ncbi:4280_t:CDS:2, partial [Racocetra persica]